VVGRSFRNANQLSIIGLQNQPRHSRRLNGQISGGDGRLLADLENANGSHYWTGDEEGFVDRF
jgi:hypothetical protein